MTKELNDKLKFYKLQYKSGKAYYNPNVVLKELMDCIKNVNDETEKEKAIHQIHAVVDLFWDT